MHEEFSGDREESSSPEKRYLLAAFNDPHILGAILSIDGSIQHVNRAAVELVHPDESELKGTPFWEGPWWEHSQRVQDDLRWRVEHAATGEYIEFESEYYTGKNERRLTAGLFRPVTDNDGDVVSIIVSGRDVTDHIHRQQQVEVFQRILRHDFRNGLNIIKGSAEELTARLSDLDDQQNREGLEWMVKAIADEASALEQKISKMKQFEHHNPGSQEYIAVEALVTRVINDIKAESPECTIQSAVPEMEVEVPTTFSTAVTEAIRIVIKHHPKSDPVVKLTAATVPDAEPPHVQLRIINDGPGIPPSEAEPVLTGEETALTHTSGVGLWLTKWIVERHGGAVSISGDDSQENHLTLLYPVPFLTQ